MKRLSGPGTEAADVPGVMAGGGKWPSRYSNEEKRDHVMISHEYSHGYSFQEHAINCFQKYLKKTFLSQKAFWLWLMVHIMSLWPSG